MFRSGVRLSIRFYGNSSRERLTGRVFGMSGIHPQPTFGAYLKNYAAACRNHSFPVTTLVGTAGPSLRRALALTSNGRNIYLSVAGALLAHFRLIIR
jgi:hypothetical protein